MVRFEDIKFDCRLFNGYKPCIYGNECAGCPWYEPQDTSSPRWFPKLESDAVTNLPADSRILIIKTGALGDVLRTTTILHPIIRQFPEVHITWITAPAAMPLLSANEQINTLTAFQDEDAGGLLHEKFDLSICLEKEGYPLVFAGLVQAEHKVGYFPTPWSAAAIANEESRYMMLLGVSDELKFFKNKLSYPQIICEAAGFPFKRDPYILRLTEASIAARQYIRSQLNGQKKIVGLNTGCGAVFRTKQWTLQGWAATATTLQTETGCQVVLMGGTAEEELNRAIMEQVPGLLDAGTDNSLEDFFGIVDACDIVVTSDSLGMHIAIALQKHVVALFGSTSHHEIDLYDRGEKVITDFPCSPCYLKTCDKKPTCMEAMSANTVVAAVRRGFKSTSQPEITS